MQQNPRKFYVFCGDEYGVKKKYLDIIAKIYSGRKVEMESVDKVLKMMSVKKLIPLEPTLYIVRYDDTFLKDLDKYSSKISKTKIIGTIVVIYDTETAENRCNKCIPDNLVIFEPVDTKFIFKYLKNDFPELEDSVVNTVLNTVHDYISAYNICYSLNNTDRNIRVCLDEDTIRKTFCYDQSVNIELIKYGIAARDARYCFNLLYQYDGASDAVVYQILNALLEVEKCLVYKKGGSYAMKHISSWNIYDVQSMFQNLYELLIKSRLSGTFDLMHGIECVIASMSYSPIMKIAV